MPRKKKPANIVSADPQKSSAAQFLTYVASAGVVDERFVDVGDGRRFTVKHYNLDVFQAQRHAETEFERYKLVQDRLFQSDYDCFLLELERQTKEMGGGSSSADGKDPATP